MSVKYCPDCQSPISQSQGGCFCSLDHSSEEDDTAIRRFVCGVIDESGICTKPATVTGRWHKQWYCSMHWEREKLKK